jgi:antitoxin ParD1/3/4
MKITLEVPPSLEARLREYLASGDPAEVERLLATAIASAAEAMLWAREHPPLSDAEFEALADELADHMEACAGEAAARLPDEAITREGIYGDHP